MAVVETKSTIITNLDASPQVANDAHLVKGMLVEAVAEIELAATDSSDSKLYYCPIPSNARVSQILLSCDDSGTTGTSDFGIWERDSEGTYTVKDQDLFASAQAFTTALSNSDITYESGQYDVAESDLMLWEVLGETSDPRKDYYLVGVLQQSPENAATTCIKVRYVI